jgi:Uma2 family endonuclease
MTAELDYLIEDEELEAEHMPTFEHSVIGNKLNRLLGNYVEENKLGQVLDSTVEYRFLEAEIGKRKRPGRQPDVSFVSQANLPEDFNSYPDIVPELVVEIESPTDYSFDIQAKILEYQKAGVKLIWIVRPPTQTVLVYKLANGAVPEGFGIADKLDGEDVIGGLQIAVKDIFSYPQTKKSTQIVN